MTTSGSHAPTVLVSAGVIVSGGRVLLTQRKEGAHLGGSWEFPGGKVEPGEDPRDALVRELSEELGVEAEVGDIVEVTFHRYPSRTILLLFFAARLRPGSPAPSPIDVADLRWAALEDLDALSFAPADRDVLIKVRKVLATGELPRTAPKY